MTHLAFYVGWPNVFSALPVAKEVFESRPAAAFSQQEGMMVRISEIQVDSTYLDAYTAILEEEAEASVRLEPGVVAIFPMQQRENPVAGRTAAARMARSQPDP